MSPLFWSVILLFVGLGTIFLELFIPSAGILGVVATLVLLGGVWQAFVQGPLFGLGYLGVLAVGLPFLWSFMVKWWPKTFVGRQVILANPTAEEVLPNDEKRQVLKQLVGKTGRAVSRMMPSGLVLVEGHRIDAISEGVAVEPGQPVTVLSVSGNQVIVRVLAPKEVSALGGEDALNQSIEELGLDSFEDPLK